MSDDSKIDPNSKMVDDFMKVLKKDREETVRILEDAFKKVADQLDEKIKKEKEKAEKE